MASTKNLSKLRSLMNNQSLLLNGRKLEAYIVPSSDSHGSEYLCEKDKRRAFLSGFTGSTGTAVVTDEKALLWTDGRYFLQASQQLDINWTLMKDGLAETPSIGDWLVKNIPPYSIVGIDTTLYEENLFKTLEIKLKENFCELVDTKKNLIDIVRDEFENVTFKKEGLIKLDPVNTGLSTKEKLCMIREHMTSLQVDSMVVSSLDDIAWLMNLRGKDIPYGAVFFAYCIITAEGAKLFTDIERLNETYVNRKTFKDYLMAEDNFEFYNYENFLKFFQQFVHDEFIEKYKTETKCLKKIFLSSSSSHAIHSSVPVKFIHSETSYLTKLRTIKNHSEIEAAKRIHTRDSLLLVEFFYKLQTYDFISKDHFNFELNEFNLGKCLDDLRRNNVGCLSPSFETICSSGANGAIIHYKPEKETCNIIEKDNILLIDSGGHYVDMGTTDVTRTVFLGDVSKISPFQRECFTRVLKGHIQLSKRVFPSGLKPELLDSFARQALWEGGLDYGHGTGHGVGSLLNVHEVPIISSRKGVDIGVEENMIITIEPGYYKDGQFGIRIENCNLVVAANTKNKSPTNFVCFEPLTLVPLQRELIDLDLLNEEERAWIDKYHLRCAEIIGKELLAKNNLDTHDWLLEQTKPL